MIYKISMVEFSKPSSTTNHHQHSNNTTTSTGNINTIQTKSKSNEIDNMKRKRNKIEKDYSIKVTRIETRLRACCKLLPYETLFHHDYYSHKASQSNNRIASSIAPPIVLPKEALPQAKLHDSLFISNQITNHHNHLKTLISSDEQFQPEMMIASPSFKKQLHYDDSIKRRTVRSAITIKELLN